MWMSLKIEFETLFFKRLYSKLLYSCAEITPLMLNRVRENFMRRIAFCLEENGGH